MSDGPDIPAPTTPQEAKPAETQTAVSRRRQAVADNPAGTLLTGPSGVDRSKMNLGGATLLGQ